MTNASVITLWKLQTDMQVAEHRFWVEAGELLQAGLVAPEDIAVIYGCHPTTAYKRAMRYLDVELEQRAQARRARAAAGAGHPVRQLRPSLDESRDPGEPIKGPDL